MACRGGNGGNYIYTLRKKKQPPLLPYIIQLTFNSTCVQLGKFEGEGEWRERERENDFALNRDCVGGREEHCVE